MIHTGAIGLDRLLVFDLDGTLIDSKDVMIEAFRESFDAAVGSGVPPIDEFLHLLGAPFPAILDRLGLPARMAALFQSASIRRIDRIKIHEHAVAACRTLRGHGLRTAVLTGKDRRRTEETLARLELDDLFDAVVAGDDLATGKPHPDGVLHLCRLFGVDAGHTVVTGDSTFDIMAARAAGATAIGCLWGMAEADDLSRAGAQFIVARPCELLSTLTHVLELGPLVASAGSGDRTA